MGSRQESKGESQVQRQTLEDRNLRAALRMLSDLLTSALGPHGRIHSLQNTVDGPITETTSSSRLLSTLTLSRPCLRLISAAIQDHLTNHRDGGLFGGALCLNLVLNALNAESVSHKCVRRVYEALLSELGTYLNSEDCGVRINLDTSNLQQMLAYTRSIIATKPLCGLSRPGSVEHLTQLVLRAFLTSVPETPRQFQSGRVFILQCRQQGLASSEVLEGLCLEWPEKSALFGPAEVNVANGICGETKVALVTVSMSGDVEDLAADEVEAGPGVSQAAEDFVLGRMSDLVTWLVKQRVGLLLCQRVVHPRLKASLGAAGIICLDRLGAAAVPYIIDLTECVPITSALREPRESSLGGVSSASHRVIRGKSYLHLERAGSPVCTLVLCGAMEEQLAEIKSVVLSAMRGLYSTLQRPTALCGGGCWQVHAANYLRHLVQTEGCRLRAQLGVTAAQLHASVSCLASGLEATALALVPPTFTAWTDPQHWHVWHAPPGVEVTSVEAFACACGMLSSVDIDPRRLQPLIGRSQNSTTHNEDLSQWASGALAVGEKVNPDWLVLDPAECFLSALNTAVVTASTVLSIDQYIHDSN